MATFVLVHGAAHGGWCWRDVRKRLAGRGHAATAPTLTGLGERSHLLSRAIDLDTHVADVVNHLAWEDLTGVVLVAHSYAGAVALGVADRAADRLAALILLDAMVLEAGESALDSLDPDARAARLRAAEQSSGGVSIPVPPAEAFGLSDPDQIDWAWPKLTPHPIGSYAQALRLVHPRANGLPVSYIACTAPAYPAMLPMRRRAEAAGWPVHELATAHDAMITAPAATADLLDAIAEGRAATA